MYFCLPMVISGATMALADALGHYERTGTSLPSTLGATVPALIALIAAAF